MKTFTYNLCLLITFKDNPKIEIIKMQIDNILILGDIEFLIKKQVEINKVGFLIKLV